MSRGLASMAAVLAGIGTGLVAGKEEKEKKARQARLDQQANDLHTARMSEINDAQTERQTERDYKGAMAAALSAGKTDAGQVVTDATGSNAFTKDADAAVVMQDMAQTLNGGAQAAPATRVLTGMQGATQRGTIPGQQVFTDPAKAQEFAQSMPMTEYAKLQARKAVAEQYGKLDVADDVRVKLESLASRGVFQAGSLLDAGNADAALKVLQNANPDLVPKGAQFKQVDVPDMFDRSKTTKGWALVAPGAEGQPESVLVGDFRDAVFGYLTPEKQFDAKRALATDARAANQWQQTFEQNAEQFKQNKTLQQQQIGISAGHLGIAREEAARKKLVFDQESKVPDSVKKAYAPLEATAKAMDAAMYKAQADGTWQDNDASRKLLADRARVSRDMQSLLEPYLPKQEKAAGDKPPSIESLEGGSKNAKTPEPAAAPAPAARPAVKPAVSTAGLTAEAKKAAELKQAHQDWLAAKQSWFSQRTPTSEAREREAEARYTELLRNQYQK